MTSNLILMTRDLPLSPSQVQKWDQSRQLVQYKLSSESQPLPSYLILHYGPPLDPSYLEGFIEAIEIREYEMVQHNPPFQKEVESPGPYHFHPTLSHPSLTTHSAVKDPKHGTHLLLESLTPADGSDDDVDSWYREQYIPDLAKSPTYLLTKRYKLIQSQANVENLPHGKMHWASPPPYISHCMNSTARSSTLPLLLQPARRETGIGRSGPGCSLVSSSSLPIRSTHAGMLALRFC